MTIAWKTPIDSLWTVADSIIPTMGVNENALIVFTVPMCFRPSENRNSALQSQKTEIIIMITIIMIGSNSISMYNSVPVDSYYCK